MSRHPAGRPKGTGDPAKLIERHERALVQKCLAAGLGGDVGAAAAILIYFASLKKS